MWNITLKARPPKSGDRYSCSECVGIALHQCSPLIHAARAQGLSDCAEGLVYKVKEITLASTEA